MNTTEKLAATYLRLNGFLLLPHFTIFTGQQHSHIDLIGLHPMNGVERAGELALPKDDDLFDTIRNNYGLNPEHNLIGIVAEVKTNQDVEEPSPEKLNYAGRFLGNANLVPICFTDRIPDIQILNGTILIGLNYTFNWIMYRINWMEQRRNRLSKEGSWNWSEDFLADILIFKQLGFYRE